MILIGISIWIHVREKKDEKELQKIDKGEKRKREGNYGSVKLFTNFFKKKDILVTEATEAGTSSTKQDVDNLLVVEDVCLPSHTDPKVNINECRQDLNLLEKDSDNLSIQNITEESISDVTTNSGFKCSGFDSGLTNIYI